MIEIIFGVAILVVCVILLHRYIDKIPDRLLIGDKKGQIFVKVCYDAIMLTLFVVIYLEADHNLTFLGFAYWCLILELSILITFHGLIYLGTITAGTAAKVGGIRGVGMMFAIGVIICVSVYLFDSRVLFKILYIEPAQIAWLDSTQTGGYSIGIEKTNTGSSIASTGATSTGGISTGTGNISGSGTTNYNFMIVGNDCICRVHTD